MSHIRWATVTVVACVLWLVPQAAAQSPVPAAVRLEALDVFLDCESDCDSDYLRNEITIINHVRDPRDADVHVLVTRQTTGGGGTEYALNFIGLGRFAGAEQTLRYVAPQASTEDERRRGVAEVFKRGLVRYVADTTLADRMSIDFLPPTPVEGTGARGDRWNLWVFGVNLGGSFSGERSNEGGSMRGSLSANRTTDAWKATLFTSTSYRTDTFQLNDAETFRSVSRTVETSALAVKSLTGHWSAGLVASLTSSTFLNYDLKTRIASGIEYNLFPYSDSTRRMLAVQYTVGGNSMDYEEETIFGKTSERLMDHRLATSFSMREQWGSGFAEVAFSQFLNEPDKFNVAAFGDANVRLSRGFSLTISAQVSRTQDQLSLPRTGATIEEILVRERQLATAYRYSLTFGVTYSFGSIFNNVVNPRFGGGGGDPLF
jgi:hypothetical protein